MSVLRDIEYLERRMSQKEIARRLGVNPRTVRKWKTGERKISVSSSKKLKKLVRSSSKIKPKKIFRRRKFNRQLGMNVFSTEYRHEIIPPYTVSGMPELDMNDMLQSISDFFKMLLTDKVFRREFRRMFDGFNKGGPSDVIQLLIRFRYGYRNKIEGRFVWEEYTSPSHGLFPGEYVDWEEALEALLSSIKTQLLSLLVDSPKKDMIMEIYEAVIRKFIYRRRQ